MFLESTLTTASAEREQGRQQLAELAAVRFTLQSAVEEEKLKNSEFAEKSERLETRVLTLSAEVSTLLQDLENTRADVRLAQQQAVEQAEQAELSSCQWRADLEMQITCLLGELESAKVRGVAGFFSLKIETKKQTHNRV